MTNRKKGFTLVELVITLTLTALVSGMIVSFCVLINDRVKKNSRMTTQLEELTFLRTFIERWMAEYDREEVCFEAPSGEDSSGVFLYACARGGGESVSAPSAEDQTGATIAYLCLADQRVVSRKFEKGTEEGTGAFTEVSSAAATVVSQIEVELFNNETDIYLFSVRYGGIESFKFLVNRRTVPGS